MIEQRQLFSMQQIALRARANANIADFVRAIRVALLLRFSLAAVFFWFGMLKLAGVSPVVALLQNAIPFLARPPYIELIGAAEIVIAIGLLIDRFSDQAAALMILHLFCTLSLVIIAPTLVFAPAFPVLTLDGEFPGKKLRVDIRWLSRDIEPRTQLERLNGRHRRDPSYLHPRDTEHVANLHQKSVVVMPVLPKDRSANPDRACNGLDCGQHRKSAMLASTTTLRNRKRLIIRKTFRSFVDLVNPHSLPGSDPRFH